MFNAQEKQQIYNLVNTIVKPLSTAVSEIAVAVQQNQDPTLIKQTLVDIKSAMRDLNLAYTLLIGGNAEANFNTPRKERPIALATAYVHLDRVKNFTNAAIKDLATATGTNMVRARTIVLPQALAGLSSFDRTLPYLDPHPNDTGTLVGPHGDYLRATWEVWRAWWYLIDMFEYSLNLWGDPGVNWYQIVSKTPVLFNNFARGMARLTDIDTTSDEIKIRSTLTNIFGQQFFLLLGYSQMLSDYEALGAPQAYHELQSAISSGVHPDFGTVRIRISDSWRHMDKIIWHAFLEFPGCDMQKDPQGCAKKLPSQQPQV